MKPSSTILFEESEERAIESSYLQGIKPVPPILKSGISRTAKPRKSMARVKINPYFGHAFTNNHENRLIPYRVIIK